MKPRYTLVTVTGVALLLLGLISPSSADFDRELFYQKCRRTPGFMARATLCSDSLCIQASYEDCMQECDRQFWKDFDEKTEGLDKTTK